MKQLESPSDWLEARQLKTRDQSEHRPDNIFTGKTDLSQSDVQGVRVFRIMTSPDRDAPVPVSFSTGDPSEGPEASEDRSGNYVWTEKNESEEAILPLSLAWQQSAASRWDFYFHLEKGAYCLGLGERLSGLDLRGRIHTLFTHSD
ncbi:MAG: hypothetical protein K8F91_06145, partial [Candidatus Obscuribacterales bacterium]|nr:hypothetical protein [Candidatus Obscuribacterales bacterium]